MSSPSGPKSPSSIEMVPLGKKSVGTGGDSGVGKSKTSFSSVSMKMDSKSMQVSQNQDGHKSSLRSTANTMKLQTGNDKLSFDFSKGQLSIKTGDTSFSLTRGQQGLKMSATDLKSKTTQGFDVSGSKVTKTLKTPGVKDITSISKDPHLGALAAKHSERIGEMKSPFQAFKASPLGDIGGKGPDHKIGFSAFKRETRDSGGTVTKTERGFKDLSSEGGKKSKTRPESAFGHGAGSDLVEMQETRGAKHRPRHRGRTI
jgi:hypothetical protein